jgi:hypothetical protein
MGNIFRKEKTKDELKLELNKLKQKNIILLAKVEALEQQLSNDTKQEIKLSKEMIQNYVNEFLANDENNIDYLPDVVERQIYINIFNKLIQLASGILEKTSIQFLNHTISINVAPKQ